MIQGLYAAATGMITIEDQQSVIANNIANSATVGFKRQNATAEGFKQVFLGQAGTAARLNATKAPGGGLRLLSTYTDQQSGPLLATGDPLNIALTGPGFITVTTPDGQRYTRNGAFKVDQDGQLATSDGYKIQGDGGGPITVSGGAVSFDRSGNVLIDNQPVGKLGIVEFADVKALQHDGTNLFASATGTGTPATNTEVAPGTLEGSNVQLPVEMASMILGLRAYAANQKVISSVDDTLTRLIDDVGTPA